MGRCIVYIIIRLLLLIRPFIFSFFFPFQTFKFFVTLFSGTVRPRRLTPGQWAYVSYIPESGCCCLFVSLFFIFFLSNFQRLKFFVTLLSGTVRPRRLKLVTHVDNGWMYRVYRNHAAAFIRPFISSFSFLSNFQAFKEFSSHFSQELWGVEDWNLVHTWTVGRCVVYTGIRLLLLIHPFISSFYFLSSFQTLTFFFTLFSGTVRPGRLKLGTHMDSGQMHRVYRNQSAADYSPLYFFIFLSL